MFTRLKDKLKSRVFSTAGIAYNPYGVPFVLGKHIAHLRDIVLVDIGAHTGTFASSVERMCGVRRGLLVEPQPAHAALLRRNFKEPRFSVVEAALSDWQGHANLTIRNFDATTSLLPILEGSPDLVGTDTGPREVVQCAVSTLARIVSEAGLHGADLIKIDVQGAELAALAGGEAFVSESQYVWVEVSFRQLYRQSCLFHEVHEQLGRYGHKLLELEPGYRSPSGELIQADALFGRP